MYKKADAQAYAQAEGQEEEAKKCNYNGCKKKATLVCPGCNLKWYCGLECRNNDFWDKHMYVCNNKVSYREKKAVYKANLSFYQTFQQSAEKILRAIGVIFGQGGVRAKFRLAKDLNKLKKDGKVTLAFYCRDTQTIMVTFLDIRKKNEFLFTLIHEMLHAWFHQVAKYHTCVVDGVDQEEEGACELFAYLLLCKKFKPSYVITFVSTVKVYKDPFDKLKKELKIPDDPSKLTYEDIKHFLHEYVKRRN